MAKKHDRSTAASFKKFREDHKKKVHKKIDEQKKGFYKIFTGERVDLKSVFKEHQNRIDKTKADREKFTADRKKAAAAPAGKAKPKKKSK